LEKPGTGLQSGSFRNMWSILSLKPLSTSPTISNPVNLPFALTCRSIFTSSMDRLFFVLNKNGEKLSIIASVFSLQAQWEFKLSAMCFSTIESGSTFRSSIFEFKAPGLNVEIFLMTKLLYSAVLTGFSIKSTEPCAFTPPAVNGNRIAIEKMARVDLKKKNFVIVALASSAHKIQ